MSRVVALCCLVAAMLAFCLALSWGAADFEAQQGYDAMDRWDLEEGLSLDDWQAAYTHIHRAATLNPFHPAYEQRLARLYRHKAYLVLDEPEEKALASDRAREHLERSLDIRPNWPSALADLVYLKGLRGEFDEEMSETIALADVYGPWEPETIYYVSYTGLFAIDRLPAETQSVVLTFVARGHVSTTGGLFESITELVKSYPQHRYGVIDHLLPWLAGRDWPAGARSQLLLSSDWAWPYLSSDEQDQVVDRAVDALHGNLAGEVWLRELTQPGFEARVCGELNGDAPAVCSPD